VIELAATDRDTVERGLRLKKVGNHIMELVGGRAIHPVNVRVGGFHRTPTPAELARLRDELRWARDAAVDTVGWVADFDMPGPAWFRFWTDARPWSCRGPASRYWAGWCSAARRRVAHDAGVPALVVDVPQV
jgi:hypothetical protein